MEYVHVMQLPDQMNVFCVVMHYVQQNEAKHVLSWSRKGNGMLDTLIKDWPHRICSCDAASGSDERIPCGYALRTTEWSKTRIKLKSKG